MTDADDTAALADKEHVDSPKQITLPVDDLEGFIDAAVERKLARGPGPKHYKPKGDGYWIAVRGNVLRLLHDLGAVCWSDIETDPWFQTQLPKLDLTDHAGLDHVVKWDRCIKKLVQGSERAEGDTSEIVFFDVPRRGSKTRFVCLRPEIHCGADRAATVTGLSHERRGAFISNTRRRWSVTGDSCPRCASGVV